MFKQFLKDSVVYGIANVLARGISLLLLPFYVHELTQTDFGITDILTVFTALVSLTIALEISQAVAIYYTEAKDIRDKIGYASTSLWFTLGIYSIFVVICLVLADPLSQLILGTNYSTRIFQIAVLSTLSYGLLYLALNQLRWQLHPTHYALASLVTTLTTIGTTILFVLFFHMGALGVICGQFSGNTLGAITALYLGRGDYNFSFDLQKLKKMLRFSVPLVPSSVGVFVMFYIDRIAIRVVMSMADVGIFAVAYRITSVVSLLMVAFRGALTPLVYNRYEKSETPSEIALIFRYFTALALLIITGMGLFSREILIIFASPSYYSANTIIPILSASLLLAEMYIFTPGLTITKKTTAIAVINISGAVLTTLLNLSLIPVLGISGAALSNLITNFLVFTVNMVFSQRTYYVPHRWKPVFLAALLAIVIIYIAYQIPFGFLITLLMKVILFLLFAFSLVLVGLIEWSKIRELWNQMPGIIRKLKNKILLAKS